MQKFGKTRFVDFPDFLVDEIVDFVMYLKKESCAEIKSNAFTLSIGYL